MLKRVMIEGAVLAVLVGAIVAGGTLDKRETAMRLPEVPTAVDLPGVNLHPPPPRAIEEKPIALAAASEADLADIGTIKSAIDRMAMRPGWEKIEIEKAEKRSYSLTLWYRESAMPARAEPEADSKAVARAVLGALVGAGREPAKESIFVSVSAMRHMRGETGAALVNWYGITSYNYNRDALEYKECSSKSWFGC
jgi:hypothetical protein